MSSGCCDNSPPSPSSLPSSPLKIQVPRLLLDVHFHHPLVIVQLPREEEEHGGKHSSSPLLLLERLERLDQLGILPDLLHHLVHLLVVAKELEAAPNPLLPPREPVGKGAQQVQNGGAVRVPSNLAAVREVEVVGPVVQRLEAHLVLPHLDNHLHVPLLRNLAVVGFDAPEPLLVRIEKVGLGSGMSSRTGRILTLTRPKPQTQLRQTVRATPEHVQP